MELVSVIIPTYNRFDCLMNTINSVVNQTYKNIEIIVVNDCSTQIEYYAYDWDKIKNLTVIHLLENSKDKLGYPCVGYVINQGMKVYKGEYFSTCDDDDVWFPEKIELQLDAMKKNNCKMSSTEGLIGIGPFLTDKKYKKHNSEHYYNDLMNIYKNKGSELLNGGFPTMWSLKFLMIHNCIINSSVVIHKDIIEKIGGQLEIKMGGVDIDGKIVFIDYEYWLRALQHTLCVYVDTPCVYYDNGHGGGQNY